MYREKLFFIKLIPESLKKPLFGDREKYGLCIKQSDPDWLHWQEVMSRSYIDTQQQGIGDRVCRMAYSVVTKICYLDQKVLEIGPGIIRHLDQIKEKPQNYTICDVSQEFLRDAEAQLTSAGIPCTKVLLSRDIPWQLPFPDASFDTVITFFSLEHLYPLDQYLIEICRIMRPGAQIIGGIPCEGGLAWGLGRFLITRPEIIKRYQVKYDKLICWEHPNFADFIISRLSYYFKKEFLQLHPFPWLPLDLNFVANFIFRKS
jgi:SAM-dependent methyltransferase